MRFTFYSTCYPPFTNKVPITIDYSESSKKKLEHLKNHESSVMVHSGNWWSMKNPGLRTAESVLAGAEKIYQIVRKNKLGARFDGYMACNEQPIISSDEKKEKPGDQADKGLPYWIGNPNNMIPYIEKSIENADWAIKNQKIKTPVYCTIQAVNYEQAKQYFKVGNNHGHSYFSIGVSEFLKYPKFKFEGIRKIFEIIKGAREVLDPKLSLHISGLSSFNLIPLIKFLGADSCDGSTPVQSALAYGTVFNQNGFGSSASALKKLLPKLKKNPNLIEIAENEKISGALKWFEPEMSDSRDNNTRSCKCSICNHKTKRTRIRIFNEGNKDFKPGEARVIHNLHVWNSLINKINFEMIKFPKKWISDFIERQNSPYSKKLFKILKST